jgi:hypothetical protein
MEQTFLWFNVNRFWVMPLVLLIVVAGLVHEIYLVFKDIQKEMEG